MIIKTEKNIYETIGIKNGRLILNLLSTTEQYGNYQNPSRIIKKDKDGPYINMRDGGYGSYTKVYIEDFFKELNNQYCYKTK